MCPSGNIILRTDSYKFTHWRQYPPGTERVYSYFESRGGKWREVVFFGLQYYLKRCLEGPVVTRQAIEKRTYEARQSRRLARPAVSNREVRPARRRPVG
jgi:hypothetical protein